MSVFSGRAENTVNAVWRLLARLTIIAGILFACYRLRAIIATLFVAAIIAYVLDPMVEWLCQRPSFHHLHNYLARWVLRFKIWYRRSILRQVSPPETRIRVRRHSLRTVATFYVFVLAVLLLWQGIVLITRPFKSEFQRLTSPEGQQMVKEFKDKTLKWYREQAPDWVRAIDLQEQLQNSDLVKTIQGRAGEMGQRVLESLKYIVEIVLLPVLAFYFLIDGRTLKHEFVSLLPRSWLREALFLIREFNLIMRSFVYGQFILCTLAGVVVGVGLAALKIQYPFLLGVLAGVTRAIPIIGPIIGGIPIIIFSALPPNGSIPTALAVLGFFTFLHFTESKFIMPLLIGDRMELHPVIVIVVLIVGGELGGLLIGGQVGALLGMFFAAPLAAIARVIIRRYWLHLRSRPHNTSQPLSPAPVGAMPSSLPETVD